jgi:hypothetical protein
MNLEVQLVEARRDNSRVEHLSDALVEVNIALYASYLVDGELEDAPFAILGGGLLYGDIESALGLDCGVLDLNQDLVE